ncbi:hypothetical protein [Polaromonas eurypsychrophila]|uniref:Uncharacterized protein n=1 Tax=Polaromonas eurypsychrophila TaxID=1614635 RepID=A0A916WC31_9BURK|nr:hypothetical protein [Polaromonas eurypsychrophila]GGA86072.1 hypothetical protein GCM10011496_03350 [Polaromonas eurypsychrophila]
MKIILATALLFAAPALVLAQAAPAAKPAAKAAAPAADAKPAAKPRATPARRAAAVKSVEENTPIDDDPNITLSPEDLEMAKRVHVGTFPCELGASVTIIPSDKRPGFFTVRSGLMRFRMHPVGSRTGAIRLEDGRAGAMWLQLGNKSMLMSQKIGQRIADECMSPDQATFAEELKRNPRPSILDAPPPAAAGAGTASAPPATPAASVPR